MIGTSDDRDKGLAHAATGSQHPVRSAVGSAALGYVAPWSTPVRMITSRLLVRRAAKKDSATTGSGPSIPRISVPTPSLPSVPTPRLPSVRASKSPSRRARTGLIVLGIAVVAGGGAAAVALRSSRRTPPPVAAHPPRVEDVPTSAGDDSARAE
ncbi:hypothetical protein OG579_12145 [Williamsia herbipolensis]|uniref:Uncharacterized protein n=1 Tax=Williamsia herbipolensis TaxID=1603258 RepID=A0AAU4JXL3_9NOCA|nr:hypothetical protein [Williamsia herbipolensis]